MHIQCIEVYELITKLELNSKQFNTHTHTHILWIRTVWNWIYEYAIYEIIWICEYEIIQFTYNYEYIHTYIHIYMN